jgi:hypothetical protein
VEGLVKVSGYGVEGLVKVSGYGVEGLVTVWKVVEGLVTRSRRNGEPEFCSFVPEALSRMAIVDSCSHWRHSPGCVDFV